MLHDIPLSNNSMPALFKSPLPQAFDPSNIIKMPKTKSSNPPDKHTSPKIKPKSLPLPLVAPHIIPIKTTIPQLMAVILYAGFQLFIYL